MSEFAQLIVDYGAEGVMICLIVLFYRGDILSRRAVEALIKLTVVELSKNLRQSVADGVRDAFDIPNKKEKE